MASEAVLIVYAGDDEKIREAMRQFAAPFVALGVVITEQVTDGQPGG